MTVLFPALAAIFQAGSLTLDKVILSIRGISHKTYIGVSFPLLALIGIVIFAVVRPPFSISLIADTFGILFLALVASILGNLIFYRALKDDRLSELETLDLLRNLPVILVSSLIFTDERNFTVLVPAVIASLAIIWSHWRNHHFSIRKHTWPFLLWMLISAPAAAGLAKVLLRTWHPVSLELVRNLALGLVLGIVFRSSIRNAPRKSWLLLLATNVLTAVAWVLYHYSYQRSGIVYTVLIFSLQPLLVYFASVFILKEPLVKKKLIAFLIVLASIATAQFLR